MSHTLYRRSVKRARTRSPCDWCGQTINIGEPCETYGAVQDGDAFHARMHPECFAAIPDEPHLPWSPGDFERGCCCQSGDCRCANKTRSD